MAGTQVHIHTQLFILSHCILIINHRQLLQNETNGPEP
jgi:hypothetical protein